jgi:hypothetical protein
MKSVDKTLQLSGLDWHAELDMERPGHLPFYLGKKTAFTFTPVSFGVLNESMGMMKKCCTHHATTLNTCSFETNYRMPYGSEPVLKRSIEFTGNHAKVITNLKCKHGFPMRHLDIDPITFDKRWVKIAIIPIPEKGSYVEEIKWEEIASLPPTILDSPAPLLVILFEDQYGNRLEIGTGDDLWRWELNGGGEVPVHFIIQKTKSGVTLTRRIWDFKGESEPPTGDHRFRWYFAWETTALQKIKRKQENITESCDAHNEQWHTIARVTRQGTEQKIPCFKSSAFNKFIRRWIRPLQDKTDSNSIVKLQNISPSLCDNPTHLNRSGKGELLHWDLTEMLTTWDWCNKILSKSGATLIFTQEKNSVLKELPSMQGVSKPLSPFFNYVQEDKKETL